jgi:hypothetical protein
MNLIPVLTIAAPSRSRRLTRRSAHQKLRKRIICARCTAMSTNPPPPPGPYIGGVGARIEEAVELIEMELRHTIAYVNDAVIPQVRKESISALRTVSDKLRDLADRFDQDKGPRR